GQLQALRAAQRAGIKVPKEALDRALGYVKKCQDAEGGFRYQSGGGSPGFARTAAGVAALLASGAAPAMEDKKLADKGLAYLVRFKPPLKGGVLDHEARIHYFYGHFYAAQAMWAAGDQPGREWYTAIRDELLNTRAGTFRHDDHWFDGT